MTTTATKTGAASTRGGPAGAGGAAPCTAVVGLQWGDEGKGKVVDLLADRFDAIVRYNGGANAGHSVVVKGERYALHIVPSGILYPGRLAIIGNGLAVDPEALVKEVEGLNARGVDTSGLVVSSRAHVVMPYHKAEDALRETILAERGGSIGTTKRGIGPCYADKAQRATAIRIGDLLRPEILRAKLEAICHFKNALLAAGEHVTDGEPARFDPHELAQWGVDIGERIGPMVRDTTYLIHDLLSDGKRIIFEGANAALLDVDHGTYPFVTSSSTTAQGIPAGAGVPPRAIGEVIGVVKAYSTRVGNGPMPTELLDATGNRIRERGREYGTTTGRPRRVGWLDLVAVRYSAMINGASGIALTLLDVLAGLDEIQVCTAYETPEGRTERFLPDAYALEGVRPVCETLAGFGEEITEARSFDDLPAQARRYVEFIEARVGIPVKIVSVGPDRAQTIRRG
jgi:adenylosuccinate synthase